MVEQIPVTVDNFARAETDRMISGILQIVGGVGIIHHDRELGPLDNQTVIRQNRDTLYSVAILDLSGGATLTVPDFGERYLSVMVIDQDHYINRVLDEPGTYELTADEFGTDYVVLAFRILYDPTDEADVVAVHRLQDGIRVESRAERAFHPTAFDPVSHKTVRDALLTLAKGISGFSGSFGRRDQVDPVRHLIATASGWGGLPDDQAQYISIFPDLPVGRYRLTLRDVPADAFYSVSVYNADGYFEPGPSAITNVNSVFGHKDADGSMTVWLGEFDDDRPNAIPTPEGWNLLIRLYRPRAADLADWQVPAIEQAS
jgi:hypothetical protein